MTIRNDGRRVGTHALSERRVSAGRATRNGELLVPSLIWIIIVVLIVLFLLGYLGRGRFRA